MNCLKCPNYWKTDIDEALCDKCGQETTTTNNQKESKEQSNE